MGTRARASTEVSGVVEMTGSEGGESQHAREWVLPLRPLFGEGVFGASRAPYRSRVLSSVSIDTTIKVLVDSNGKRTSWLPVEARTRIYRLTH